MDPVVAEALSPEQRRALATARREDAAGARANERGLSPGAASSSDGGSGEPAAPTSSSTPRRRRTGNGGVQKRVRGRQRPRQSRGRRGDDARAPMTEDTEGVGVPLPPQVPPVGGGGVGMDEWPDAQEWEPCMHPYDRSVEDRFGRADPREQCWGCRHGSAEDAPVNSERVQEMQRVVENNWGRMNIVDIAVEVHAFFEEYIRRPTNDLLEDGERSVPEWTVATIIDHLEWHGKEPAIQLQVMLERNGRVMDTIYKSQLFRRRVDETGGPVAQLQVDPDAYKLFNESMRMHMRLYAQKPARMAFHSGAGERMSGGRTVVNPHRPTFATGAPNRDFVGGN